MQEKFLPIVIGTLLGVLFSAHSAQARFLNANELQAAPGPSIAYATPQMGDSGGGNYLQDVSRMGQLRWNLSKMPLRVFIEDGSGVQGFRDYYPDLIAKAFNEWQDRSAGLISWQQVQSPDQADIICTWTDFAKPNGAGVEAGETTTTIGVNRFTGEQNIIHANVSVLTTLMGRNFSDTDTYKTCLHEVGHAIGMEGHSSSPGDIMYPMLNNNQTPYLKQRDINTIAALYSGPDQSGYTQQGARTLAQTPGYFNQLQGYSNQPSGFLPQFGRRFRPARAYANEQDGYAASPFRPDNLSFEQIQALRRAMAEGRPLRARY